MKNKINIIWASICAVLVALVVGVFCMYQSARHDIDDLQGQISDLNDQVKKSAVVKRISTQMEDIAYQQKDISDKRSDEAILQSRIANDMRTRADMMRGRADIERVKAEASEKKAVESYHAAKEQRAFAEEKQRQAEYAKRVADTLSYRALARSLGSVSTTQYQLGNKDIASLLAFSSWSFASRYKGDVFLPAIFNALSKSSQSVLSKSSNRGGITKIVFTSNRSSFITTSKYGEIIQWNDVQGEMTPMVLLRDSKYDFRDLIVDRDAVYALSRNGALYVKKSNSNNMYQLDGENFMRICDMGNNEMMFVGEKALLFYTKEGMQLIKSIPLTNQVTAVGKRDGHYMLFCQNDKTFTVDKDGTLKPLYISTSSPVTAYAWSPELEQSALGTSNGIIYLFDNKWNITQTLTGHLSAITQVDFHDDNLMSSSYDRTINMWNLKIQKVEPVALKTFSSWALCFNDTEDGMIWAGDESGDLTRIIISPFDMAKKIIDNLTRSFTTEEWNYYVGNTIPYESYKKH